jgi:hypothetical protein
MDHVSLIDTSVQTAMSTIGGSPILSALALLLIAFAIYVLIDRLRQPPRFDPTLYMERPPIDHRPQRTLPPASAYTEWEAQQDKENDHIPWNR